MCGIAGVVAKQSTNKINWVQTAKILSHYIKARGPDDEGYLFAGNQLYIYGGDSSNLQPSKKLNYLPTNHLNTAQLPNDIFLAFVHRRLSILDLSESGHQPLSDPSENYWIIYNGEIYNFQEIRSKLQKLGYKFRSNTDTEVILYSYIQWGTKCLDLFNGMFAFAIYDRKKNIIFLARDRIGIKPLFFYKNKNLFLFSSNVRAINFSNLYPKQLDYEAIWYNLAYGFTIKPLTPFKDIFLLEPGHYLILNLNNFQLQKFKYWQIQIPKQKLSDLKTAKEKLSELISDSIKYRLISDVEIATFLSGGIDSGLITAIANQLHPGIKAFTLTFPENEQLNNDAQRATLTAKKNNLNQILHQVSINEAIEHIDDIITAYEEPFPQLGPAYLLSKPVALHKIKVILIALGPDELFGGYGYYKNIRRWKLIPYLYPILKNIPYQKNYKLIKLKNSRKPKDWTEIFGFMFLRMPDNIIKKLVSNDLNYDSFIALKKYLNPYNIKFYSPIETYNYYDWMLFLVSHALYHTDQLLMDNSLEGRVPFLDHRIVEFSFSLSPKLKVKYPIFGQPKTKYILRTIAYKYLPKEVIEGKKFGFNVPLTKWMEMKLKEIINDNLLELKHTGIFDKKGIDLVLSYNIKHWTWHLVAFNLWYKKFFTGK